MLQRYFFLCAGLWLTLSASHAQEPAVLMSPDRWSFPEGTAQFVDHEGIAALQILNNGRAALKDVQFRNGTISYDFKPANSMFAGIYFRTTEGGEGEHFYLRPFKPENRLASGAVQYAPWVRGVSLWDLFYPYQGSAFIKKDAWNQVKIEVSQKQLRATLNGEVVLQIPELLGSPLQGGFTFAGNGLYANLRIEHDRPRDLPDAAGPDITLHDPRYLREWLSSPATVLPRGTEVFEASLPDSTTVWTPITAERFGLLNLSRQYDRAPNRDDRRLVWLKTTLHSTADGQYRLQLGFNDEVWVFLNGQLIYSGQNRYARASEKEPDGRCDIDNASITLSLQEGANELVIGLANEFFGWGMIARLDSTEGLYRP